MPKSLEEGFETFIGWLKPLQSEHTTAASHKDSVRRCMENNFGCTSFFETGSFGNGTGVRHYSDTDYFARCPSDKFFNDSGYTLRKVKEALQYTFPRTVGIEVKSPAVRIPFGKYASERLELTPAYYYGLVNTPMGEKYSYNIPSHDGGWMQSSPGAHNAYVNRENDRLNGKLKPLIQLVKAWKYYNQVPIYSFYLELRVTKYAEKESAIVYDIDLRNIFKFLYDNNLPDIQDPMGISGYVKACKSDAKKTIALSRLGTGYSRVLKAYDNRTSSIDNAFYWWNLFYNSEFPSR
ncbi:nucleotidyltransferase domain-containing protein [Dyadobacter sandarakinus]|uniref:Nucleotidyltransferase n=1 Tax=Dyadobacter sandarakinus TaxID=2747268 RepID=A0ABX7IB99_9BACT|nr:nucleotidyltransferase [Dyadobacter sandarakinus]QRR03085.1 nucleotidyltransferase [Dyadobacter sandarakinus]